MQKIYKIIVSIIGAVLLSAIVIVIFARFPAKGSLYQDQITSLSSGWRDQNNSETELTGIDFDRNHQAILSIPVDSHVVNSRSLCFTSRNVSFSIFLENSLIYDFTPELTGLYGKYYGDYPHTVPIPAFYGEMELHIKCTSLVENDWTGFYDMMLQDSGMHILSEMRKNIPNFLVCLVTFGMGTALFLFGIAFRKIQHNPIETISLGVITMLMSMWANSQNQVMILLTGNSASVHILDYLVLMIMPIPVLIFIGSITQNPDYKLIRIMIALSVANILFQFTAVLLNYLDYHDMLKISHMLIIANIFVVISIVLSAKKQDQINFGQQLYLVSGFAIVVLGGTLDMIRYYFFHAKDSSALSRLGLLIFVIILSAYEFQNMVAIHLKSTEAEMMHTLATEDALTGLKNRTAFNEYEQELIHRTDGYCLFVHLDVNHLKKINDTCGHAEGDKHIQAAADVIRKSFGEKGHCFRVGGDEFFAILDSETCYLDYERAVEKFQRLQKSYNEAENPYVPLAIAHGVAEYHYSQKNPVEAEKLADNRMYENKRQMKSVRLI